MIESDNDTPEAVQHVTALRKLADELSLVELVQKGQRLGVLSTDLDAQAEATVWEQCGLFARVVQSYQVPSLPLAVHQFHATEALRPRGANLDGQRLPSQQTLQMMPARQRPNHRRWAGSAYYQPLPPIRFPFRATT